MAEHGWIAPKGASHLARLAELLKDEATLPPVTAAALSSFQGIDKRLHARPVTWILDSLAGAAGFEPANAGTKNRCLTTWRRPSRRPVDARKARL